MLVRKKAVAICTALILAIAAVAAALIISSAEPALECLVSNNSEVVEAIRGGLGRNSSCLTVRFNSERDISSRLAELVDMWMDAAMAETDNPSEGDYIRYQCGGYERSCSYEKTDGGWTYTLKITPKYYSYHEYEEAVSEKVREIIDGLGFGEDTGDYEKIRTIYEYICSNVTYDRIHEKNENYYLRSTSYAALIWGNATCQGYCVTMYRLLREVGISTRIVTGEANGELHAWNIVQLGDVYYNVDATWDAGKDEWGCFLKGSSDFEDHTCGEKFRDKAFTALYPIAESSYTA